MEPKAIILGLIILMLIKSIRLDIAFTTQKAPRSSWGALSRRNVGIVVGLIIVYRYFL